MLHLRRELPDGDYEAQVSVAARRRWCCADPTTQAGRQSPYLGSVRGTSFFFVRKHPYPNPEIKAKVSRKLVTINQ